MSLFSSVPALLPDASNLHDVFFHIDYGVLLKRSNKEILNEHQQLYRFDELEPNCWYAVKVPTANSKFDRWWTVFWTGEYFITIVGHMFGVGNRFEYAPHAGEEVYAIPLRKSFAYRLPQDIIDEALTRCGSNMRVIQKEYQKTEEGHSSDESFGSPFSLRLDNLYAERQRESLVETRRTARNSVQLRPKNPNFPRTIQSTFEVTETDVSDDVMRKPNTPVFDFSYYIDTLSSPWPKLTGAPIGETYPMTTWTKGYDPKAVGYVSRADTKCDTPKALTSRQKAKRAAKRKAAKQARKRA